MGCCCSSLPESQAEEPVVVPVPVVSNVRVIDTSGEIVLDPSDTFEALLEQYDKDEAAKAKAKPASPTPTESTIVAVESKAPTKSSKAVELRKLDPAIIKRVNTFKQKGYGPFSSDNPNPLRYQPYDPANMKFIRGRIAKASGEGDAQMMELNSLATPAESTVRATNRIGDFAYPTNGTVSDFVRDFPWPTGPELTWPKANRYVGTAARQLHVDVHAIVDYYVYTQAYYDVPGYTNPRCIGYGDGYFARTMRHADFPVRDALNMLMWSDYTTDEEKVMLGRYGRAYALAQSFALSENKVDTQYLRDIGLEGLPHDLTNLFLAPLHRRDELAAQAHEVALAVQVSGSGDSRYDFGLAAREGGVGSESPGLTETTGEYAPPEGFADDDEDEEETYEGKGKGKAAN